MRYGDHPADVFESLLSDSPRGGLVHPVGDQKEWVGRIVRQYDPHGAASETIKMTQRQGNESQGKFDYSDAALDEYHAAQRLSWRPGLAMMAGMTLSLGLWKLHAPMAIPLVLLGVGLITSFVLTGQNYVIQRRAWLRLKAEKREWEAAKQAGPL